MIVVTRGGSEDRRPVSDALFAAAAEEAANPLWLSAHVFDPEYIADRRLIKSFYMAEVDRDKIVLSGEP